MERIIVNPTDNDTAESSDVSTEEDMKRAVPLSSDRGLLLLLLFLFHFIDPIISPQGWI
jgi:hypothetical protein